MSNALATLAIAMVFLPFKGDADQLKASEVHVKLTNGDEYQSLGFQTAEENGAMVQRVILHVPATESIAAHSAVGPVVGPAEAAMFLAEGQIVPPASPALLGSTGSETLAPTAPAAPVAPVEAVEAVEAAAPKELGASEPGYVAPPAVTIDSPRQAHVDRLHALVDTARTKLASADHWIANEMHAILTHLGLQQS